MAMRIDKRMTDMLPKGVISMLLQLPTLKDIRKQFLADFGIPDSVIEYVGLTAKFDARDTLRALEGSRHRAAAAGLLRRQAVGLLGAQPRPGPVQGPLVRGRRQRQDRGHHRRVERHRPRGRAEDRRAPAASRSSSPATRRSSRRPRPRSSARGGTAYTYSCDIADPESVDEVLRAGLRRPRGDRHARQQRGPLDPALRARCPTTASTTTSARSSSTTSARSG